MKYLFLSIAIFAEVIGTTSMKLSEGFTRPLPAIVTVIAYAAAFYFLSLTLKTIPTGVSYAIWSGVGIVLITLVAWIFLGQSLDLAGAIGLALIVAGVVTLTAFSKMSVH